MKSVLLRAPVLTETGYGVHSRQIAKWLLEKNIDLTIEPLIWGDCSWIVDPDRDSGFIKRLMELTGNKKQRYDITFQVQLPFEWDSTLGNYNVGITAGVETDSANPSWASACNKMNEIVTPSQFSIDSLQNKSKINVPYHVIPESFNQYCSDENYKLPNLDDIKTKTNFLVFGQLTGGNPFNDRKNIFFTLKWISDVFKDDEDVGIILKTNAGRMTKIDKKICTDLFSRVMTEIRGNNKKFNKVHLLHGYMPDEYIAGLYRHPKVSALVSLTRAEGFGLTMLDAAASGLPIIATGWSGHTEYLNNGRYINIPYTLSEIHDSRVDNQVFMKGSKWANPDEQEFKKKIKKFKENQQVPKEWAKDLQTKIKEKYNFNEIKNIYDSKFSHLF